jgi:asparagine synthase (glutamine-hydrolysing)
MSGICGICEQGVQIATESLDAMLAALTLEGESGSKRQVGRSFALGVAQRWPFQQVASLDGVRIAIDADLLSDDDIRAARLKAGADQESTWLAKHVAELYLRHGEAFLEKIHGAFALALWDENAMRCMLAVDRIGIKPLYWSQQNDKLTFASRLSAVRAGLNGVPQIDPAAITQYLIFSAVSAPLSAFKGVERIRPGHFLTLVNGSAQQKAYWDLKYEESRNTNIAYWSERVRDGIRDAVHAHVADLETKNTGAYLSGGTDSSSVVAFMSERLKPVNTFSIAFTEDAFNEIDYARTTADVFHTSHNELFLKPADVCNAIPKVISFFDEPFANSSAVGAYFCAKMAREKNIDTLLAGDGGDEIFAGNERYTSDRRFAIYRGLPAWLRKGLIEPIVDLLPKNGGRLGLPNRYVRRANIPNPRRTFSYNLFLSEDPQTIFEAAFLRQSPPSAWMSIADGHFQGACATSDLNRMLYLDVKMILADNDLRKVTGTAELAGVNVRYPLLDDRLAQLSGSIPTSLKLRGKKKRFIFKKAMEGILPGRVLQKRKHGFGVPLAYWLLQDPKLSEMVRDLFSDRKTRERGYFRPEFYDYLVDRHRKDHVGFYGEVVWYLMVLELWHRLHYDQVRGGQLVH